MPVEGLAHPIARARGPGLITQHVDHPAKGYSPSPCTSIGDLQHPQRLQTVYAVSVVAGVLAGCDGSSGAAARAYGLRDPRDGENRAQGRRHECPRVSPTSERREGHIVVEVDGEVGG